MFWATSSPFTRKRGRNSADSSKKEAVMSYRCVIVSNPAHISTRSEQLVVETDERHTVPIEDISALMLESRRATLSAAALSALAQNGTAVFVCDEKHLPCGVLLPAQPPACRGTRAAFADAARQKTLLAAARHRQNRQPGGMSGAVRQNTRSGLFAFPRTRRDKRR